MSDDIRQLLINAVERRDDRIEALEAQLADAEATIDAFGKVTPQQFQKEIGTLKAQLAVAREALEAAEAAYAGLCGRIGYEEYQQLEDKATELRRAALGKDTQ